MKKLLNGFFAILLLFICIIPLAVISAEETESAKVTFSEVSAKKGETVEIIVTLSDSPSVKSMGVSPIYDTEKLEYLNGEWLISGGLLQDWSNAEQNGVILYSETKNLNGNVAKYSFKIKDNDGWDDIAFSAKIVLKDDSGNIDVTVIPTYIVVKCDHSWNSEVLTVPSTCKESGYTYKVCSICNRENVISNLDKLEHVSSDWIVDEVATIYKQGKKHKECLDCGEVLIEQIIPILGTCVHSLGEEIFVRSSTCDKGGYIYNVCSICDEENVLYELEKLDHEESDWITVNQATENSEGLQHKKCINCDAILSTRTVPTLGTCTHNYSEKISTVFPTCKEEGYVCKVCTICNDKDILCYLDKLDHEESDWIVDKEATVNSAGLKHKKCINCNQVLLEEQIPILSTCNHLFGEEVFLKQATENEYGEIYKVCSICSKKSIMRQIPKLESSNVNDDSTINKSTAIIIAVCCAMGGPLILVIAYFVIIFIKKIRGR